MGMKKGIHMKENFKISHTREKYTKPILFHSHDFYEVYFFGDGKVKYYIEDEVYALTKGDILIIPPGKLHRPVIEKNLPYERHVLWIYGSYVYNSPGIRSCMDRLNRTVSEKNTRRAVFCGPELRYLINLFTGLLKDYNSEDSTDNITETPSLDELSEKFYVSKYYLLRKFKEHTKTTIHQYILMKKINLAKELLVNGCSPQKAFTLCGFSTYSNFYKAFVRETRTSPRDFVKK